MMHENTGPLTKKRMETIDQEVTDAAIDFLKRAKEQNDQWKIVFAEQREHGLDVWQEPFVPLRLPKLFTLRADPFETADHEGMDYERWRVEHLFVMVPAQTYVAKFLETFKLSAEAKAREFLQVMENMQNATSARAN